MKKCVEYLEHISAYADGELADPDKKRVEEHLSACESCSALLELYREVSVATIESSLPAPEALRDGVMDVIRGEEPGVSGNVKKPKVIRMVLTRYAPIAACLALLLLTLPWIIDNTGRRDNDTASAPMTTAPMADIAMEADMDYGAAVSPAMDDALFAVGGGDMPAPEPAPAPAPEEPEEAHRTTGRDTYYDYDSLAPSEALPDAPAPIVEEDQTATAWNTGQERDGAESEPEELLAIFRAQGDHYAWIEITGELPGLLEGRVSVLLEDQPDWDLLFMINLDEAHSLIDEISGRSGVNIYIVNVAGDYAIVLYRN